MTHKCCLEKPATVQPSHYHTPLSSFPILVLLNHLLFYFPTSVLIVCSLISSSSSIFLSFSNFYTFFLFSFYHFISCLHLPGATVQPEMCLAIFCLSGDLDASLPQSAGPEQVLPTTVPTDQHDNT